MFARLAPQSYEAVREQVRNGDILLCSAHDAGSRLIRWATRSPWSHIAIAFRLQEIDRVMALECVEHIGVRAVPLSDFVRRTSSGQEPYPGKILLARHAGMAARSDAAAIRRITTFAFDRLGTHFSQKEAAKIGLRLALGRLNIRLPGRLQPDDEYICSEYVARCLAVVGIDTPWDGLGFIAPSDFALDPDIEAVAQVRT